MFLSGQSLKAQRGFVFFLCRMSCCPPHWDLCRCRCRCAVGCGCNLVGSAPLSCCVCQGNRKPAGRRGLALLLQRVISRILKTEDGSKRGNVVLLLSSPPPSFSLGLSPLSIPPLCLLRPVRPPVIVTVSVAAPPSQSYWSGRLVG